MNLKKQRVDDKKIWREIENKTAGIKGFSDINKKMKSYIVELEKEVKQLKSRGSPRGSPRGAGNICQDKQDMLKAFDYVISYAFTEDPLDQYLIKFKQFAAGGVANYKNKKQKSVVQNYKEIVQRKKE